MGKFIFGSMLFSVGIILCFTVIGLIIGIPMVFIGLWTAVAGATQLGSCGIAAGKAVSNMQSER